MNARRPYDLRHAAMSRWPNASAAIAARAETASTVLHTVHVHGINDRADRTRPVRPRVKRAGEVTVARMPGEHGLLLPRRAGDLAGPGMVFTRLCACTVAGPPELGEHPGTQNRACCARRVAGRVAGRAARGARRPVSSPTAPSADPRPGPGAAARRTRWRALLQPTTPGRSWCRRRLRRRGTRGPHRGVDGDLPDLHGHEPQRGLLPLAQRPPDRSSPPSRGAASRQTGVFVIPLPWMTPVSCPCLMPLA
jgi:hypothetical protein